MKMLSLNGRPGIAYRQLDYGSAASVILFGGFTSSMRGTRASAIYNYCESYRINCTVFDYTGHGSSEGEFKRLTISDWYEDCISVVDSLTRGPLIVVGSSMGGWLMLLVALVRTRRILGLIGQAPAPDFTERMHFNNEQQRTLAESGEVQIVSDDGWCGYIITEKLIRAGRNHLLLDKKELAIDCDVTLIHGMMDTLVPYEVSISIAEKVRSNSVTLHLLKSSDHYLHDEQATSILFSSIQSLLSKV